MALTMAGWGEVFALSSAMTWAIAVILLRRSGESLPAFELNLFKNLLGFSLMIPTIAWFSVRSWPGYSLSETAILLLSGFLGIAVADTWYLKALNLLGASRTGILASLYSPFVIALSAIFLAESLRPLQWVGFALVMAGVLLVTWRQKKQEIDTANLRKGAFYGAAAVMLMAVGIVMVKGILESRPFLWSVEIRLAGGLAGMLGLAALRNQWRDLAAQARKPHPWGKIFLGSLLAAYLSMILWLAGYRLTDVSVAAVLNESASAFIVLFAWLFLKEPTNARRLSGLALTLLGVVTMMMT